MDRLLKLLQEDLPLEKEPFERLARDLGISQEEILGRIRELKEEKLLRQISPIFDTRRAGYDSSLVAFKVPRDYIEEAAELVNTHPGVSHNYERNHEFNLWFTLAVPPDSELGLEGSVELLAKECKAEDWALLRTVKTFKIGVKLSYESLWDREEVEPPAPHEPQPVPLTDLERRVIRITQNDLPLSTRPFLELEKGFGIPEEEILNVLRDLKDKGVMRRFSAILRHRRAGFKANGMIVWRVERERVEEVGRYLARFKAVSHCYERTTGGGWNYNLFSMVHGREKAQVDEFAEKVAGELSVEEFRILYSLREFKKRRIRLFSEEFYEWESRHLSLC